jgi:hypothetical protein
VIRPDHIELAFSDGGRRTVIGDSVLWDYDTRQLSIASGGKVTFIAHLDDIRSIEGSFTVQSTPMKAS